MRATRVLRLACVGSWCVLATAWAQTPVGTAFTYQGRLTDGGSPASGVYDLQFVLYTASTGGAQVGPIVIKDDVTVTNGLFTASLDFGAASFAGEARWLEVSARPGAGGTFVPMAPRQELTPSPNAVFSQKAPWAGLSGVPAGFADGVDNDLLGGISCANGQIARWNGAAWVCVADSGHDHLGQMWTGSDNGLWIVSQGAGSIGVAGTATGTSGWGIYGTSSGTAGRGVYGSATAATGDTSGVYGRSSSTAGRGVYGTATAASGTTYGVYGESTSDTGRGVFGRAGFATGPAVGVEGQSGAGLGIGVYGWASSTTSGASAAGVRGRSDSPNGIGVHGVASATGGVPNVGVQGESYGNDTAGVWGRAYGTGGAGHSVGVAGDSASPYGRGVVGWVSATTGVSYGVHGRSASGDGTGVFGENTGTMFNAYGVHGSSASPVGSAVFGDALATTGPNLGVWGVSSSTEGTGVKGVAAGFTGTNYGVWGQSASPAGRGVYGWAVSASGWAGYFSGNVQVTGTITKGGGSFKIDHPLDPENKYLYHSFVESPDMKNIYDGVAVLDDRGQAVVELPAWFEALNRDFRYQLTAIGAPGPGLHIAQEVRDDRFLIGGGSPGMKVSWQVTGIRRDGFADKHRIPVEEDKPEAERGLYLHPEAFGQPEDKGIDFQERASHARPAQEHPARPEPLPR